MNELPWGNKEKLDSTEFYNRKNELNFMMDLLETTSNGNAPNILLTGIRSVGKTVFINKLKKDLENEYLTIYIDFSQADCFQKENMSVIGLMEYYYKCILEECEKNNVDTIEKRFKKFIKTNDFNIKDVVSFNTLPIPIFKNENKVNKLKDFVFNLPQDIYDKNIDQFKGIIILIDEFQIIRELGDYKESFLWLFRSYIQKQNNVAYVLTGSMGLYDSLINEIAGKQGAFGGRMLTVELVPFSYDTTKNYLKEKIPDLNFTNEGFDRFYYCTQGIPAYVNIFANRLPQNIELNEKIILEELDNNLSIITSHLINIWNRLRLREKTIIISLINKPIKRKDIADVLEVSTGSLSNYLNNLQNLGLIELNEGLYKLSEPLLGRWLQIEYNKKGVYPYRIV